MLNTFYTCNELSQGPGLRLRSPSNQPVNARLLFRSVLGLFALISLCYMLSGCGATVSAGGSAASQGSFTASPAAVDFGSVGVGGSANNSVSLVNSSSDPVVVSNLTIPGNSPFSLVGENKLPLTLAAGTTTTLKVHYGPKVAADDSGDLTITSNSMVIPKATVRLHGKGIQSSAATPVVTAVSCASASITGAGKDSCTATLSSAAPSGGFSVGLASNNAALTVPSSVTVSANATTVGFTATAAAVTTSQTVILTASGGGATQGFSLQLKPAVSAPPTTPVSTLGLSTATVGFGSVALNQPSRRTITLNSTGTAALTISAAKVSGNGFSISGLSFPTTLNPGASASLTVQFSPTAAGAVTGSIAIASNSSSGSTATVALSGTGTSSAIPSLTGLTCNSGSMSVAGTDACTVTLSAAAPSGGVTVNLASNNAAAKIPASVTVPANAASAGFSATVAAVTSAQSATLTATANSVSKTFVLTLNPASSSGGTLSINATSISFGNVMVNTPSTQSITLSASGSAVKISGATPAGTGFSVTGATFPMTVNPGSSATLNVQFDPTTTGAVSGKLTIANNSSNSSSAVVSLSGTGISHQIALTWNAPADNSDPVSGYKVYRAASGSSTYQLLNSSATSKTAFTDTSAQSGTSYQYYVTSVDSGGSESTPSNTATVAVP